MTKTISTDLAIIGGGPAGYSAAFRAADLGLSVTLIEQAPLLGGVCLRAGCIPSKTLLDAAALLNQARQSERLGIHFSPKIDLITLAQYKDQIIARLGRGLQQLADSRAVRVITATARFTDPHRLTLLAPPQGPAPEVNEVLFHNALIASGSSPTSPPGLPSDPRIFHSAQALELTHVPKRLAVLGAGIIGLELSTIYQALGSETTLIEAAPRLLPQLPAEIVRPLERQLKRQHQTLLTQARLIEVLATDEALTLKLTTPKGAQTLTADALLIATGRRPDCDGIGLEPLGIALTPEGAVLTDERGRTSLPHIYAAGDVTGNPMLAHCAIHSAGQIAEIIAGQRDILETPAIPSVLYTDPQIAWVGETASTSAPDSCAPSSTSGSTSGTDKTANASFRSATFPWSANGRTATMGRNEGLTRIVIDTHTDRLVGAQIVGPYAGDLISELTLAISAGLTALDVARIIHPHPTLSETIGGASALLCGQSIDLPPQK